MNIVKLTSSAKIPSKGSPKSAGYDLYTVEEYELKPGERKLFKTGLSIAINTGLYGRIAPRSGLALKNGIDVMAGCVDCDYRNEIGVLLINLGTEPVKIDSTKAIAQIIFENYTDVQFTTVDTLDETERKGGYGSTDKQLGFDPNPSPITNIDSKISKNSSLTDLYQKAGGIPLKEKYTDELEKRTTL